MVAACTYVLLWLDSGLSRPCWCCTSGCVILQHACHKTNTSRPPSLPGSWCTFSVAHLSAQFLPAPDLAWLVVHVICSPSGRAQCFPGPYSACRPIGSTLAYLWSLLPVFQNALKHVRWHSTMNIRLHLVWKLPSKSKFWCTKGKGAPRKPMQDEGGARAFTLVGGIEEACAYSSAAACAQDTSMPMYPSWCKALKRELCTSRPHPPRCNVTYRGCACSLQAGQDDLRHPGARHMLPRVLAAEVVPISKEPVEQMPRVIPFQKGLLRAHMHVLIPVQPPALRMHALSHNQVRRPTDAHPGHTHDAHPGHTHDAHPGHTHAHRHPLPTTNIRRHNMQLPCTLPHASKFKHLQHL